MIALAQLVVALDATVVNIALPSARHALGMSDTSRQWVVTGYALAFGGLLLLSGRRSDLFGRRRMFIAGLAPLGGSVRRRPDQGAGAGGQSPAHGRGVRQGGDRD